MSSCEESETFVPPKITYYGMMFSSESMGFVLRGGDDELLEYILEKFKDDPKYKTRILLGLHEYLTDTRTPL